jgi:hypothetical protein
MIDCHQSFSSKSESSFLASESKDLKTQQSTNGQLYWRPYGFAGIWRRSPVNRSNFRPGRRRIQNRSSNAS